MPKELGLFYFIFLTAPLYIQWDQFIIIQVTLPTTSNQVPSNIMFVLQNVSSEPIEHCDFVDPQGHFGRPPYQTRNNLDYLQIEMIKVNPQRNRNIVVPTLVVISKYNLSQIIHQSFVHVSINRLIRMTRKGLMKGFPKHIPDF